MQLLSKTGTVLKTTFRSLQYRNFRYFWVGQCISLIGTWMQRTAQVWLVYTLTKSPFLVGLLGVCQFLPMLLFSLFAGVLVDRFPKKQLLLLTQAMFLAQAVVMTALTYTGRIRYWEVLALSAFFGLTQTIDMPARQSFFVELVGQDDLMNAISLNSTIVNLARIIGPAFSGLIMEQFGESFCFLVNSVSYIAVLIGLFRIQTSAGVIQRYRRRIVQEIAEGIRYIKNSETLVVNVVIMAIVCTFAMNNDVIIPVFAKTVLGRGASGYTGLMAAAGVGAFAGAVTMAFISKNGLHKNILIVDSVLTAILQILTVLTRQYWLCVILVTMVGFINLTFINTANSIFQVNSAQEYRGRVMSVYSFLNQGSTPVGNFFAGSVMQQIGGDSGFVSCGAVTLIILIPYLIHKRKLIAGWLHESRAGSK